MPTRAHLIVPLAAFLALPAAAAYAHGAPPRSPAELLTSWGDDPAVLASLGLTAWLYFRGVRRMWRSGGAGAGVARWEASCFTAGWLSLVVALVSPLHPWGSALFSVHMTQHEILMLVAAPLLVLGRPGEVMLRALPRPWARELGRCSNRPAWRAMWAWLTNPIAAWAIHGLALWVWHLPVLFQATLTSEWVHALQHASFLGTALLFWASAMHAKRGSVGLGAAVLGMFTTALHSGILGAMLTFATATLYPAYTRTAPQWGLTALEDQQLGGLVMWIPAGLGYTAAAVAFMAGWIRESERRAQRWPVTHTLSDTTAAEPAP